MIYFDNGATTMQKPAGVMKAMELAMMTCANPGRSGHKPALAAANTVFKCRESIADFFHFDYPERVVFTSNATHALNIAIKSVLHKGGHAVISGYEHNSVVRPLNAMEQMGVTYTVAHSKPFDSLDALKQVENAITPQTKCVIINHISNVFGCVFPIEKIDAICAEKGIPLILDVSQSAGVLDINAGAFKSVSFMCMPGHKSLYGPQGTGALLCCKDDNLYSLTQGGTGSNSIDFSQPDFLPDVFESGTLNVCGIAGLKAGVSFVSAAGIAKMAAHKRELIKRSAEGLGNIKGVKVFYDKSNQEALLSFTAQKPPSEIAEFLAQHDICIRDGLHCAPLAHKSGGTLQSGTCRISFSCFNDTKQVDIFTNTVNKMLIS